MRFPIGSILNLTLRSVLLKFFIFHLMFYLLNKYFFRPTSASLRNSIVIAIFYPLFFSCTNKVELSKKNYFEHAFGTTFSIIYYSSRSVEINNAIDSILRSIDTNFSTYNLNSTVSVLNSKIDSLQVDEDFKEVFLKSKEVWEKTEGSFDPTAGILVNFWGFGPKKKSNYIHQSSIDSLMKYVGFEKVSMVDCLVKKEHSAIYLDFNALAKGYALDKIGVFLKKRGINNYLIEIGGEILAGGDKNGLPWRIAIDKPIENKFDEILALVKLTDEALASSGNYRKFYKDSKGVKRVHTMNPLTGYPETNNLLSVSVIAKTCMEADAYATAFMVMGLNKSINFINKNKNLETLLVWQGKNHEFKYFATNGFKSRILETQVLHL